APAAWYTVASSSQEVIVGYRETHIPGVVLITPQQHRDERGSFREAFNEDHLRDMGFSAVGFRQMNISESHRDVLRGLHFQRLRPQAKLVTVLAGCVVDVVVDARPGSPAYGRYLEFTLSAENGQALFIPAGCAHGFLSMAERTLFCYLCDDVYSGPEDQCGIRWDDPSLAIPWPCRNPIVSAKDARLPRLRDLTPDDHPFLTLR
ncbi:MAG: dTDP-4-dehydrorhamnose 3,5-epimerase, partial [Opitutaceae bacterium]|nr:dTDP-4-dehydrorhamnose 3,5-epimerase [Opitutaceae bacterium]